MVQRQGLITISTQDTFLIKERKQELKLHDKDLTKKIKNQRQEINELHEAVSALKSEILELREQVKKSKDYSARFIRETSQNNT